MRDNTYYELRIRTVGLSTLSLDSARTQLVDLDRVSWPSHVVARCETHVFDHSIAAFIDLSGDIFGAHFCKAEGQQKVVFQAIKYCG